MSRTTRRQVRGRSPRVLRLLALAIVLLLGAAACGGGDAGTGTADPTTTPGEATGEETAAATEAADPLAPQPLEEEVSLTMTLPIPVEVYVPPLLAQELGEFEKENLDVEVQQVPTNEAMVLLDQGRTDVHIGSPVAGTMNAIAQELNVRAVAPMNKFPEDSDTAIWVRDDWFDEDGNPIADRFEGAQFVLGPNGWGDLGVKILRDWLLEHDLTTDDVEVTSMSLSDAVVALEERRIDGSVLADPLTRQAEERGFAEKLVSYPAGVSLNYAFMGTNLLEEQPEAGEAFLRAMARTIDEHLQGDYHSDEDTVQALSEALGQDAEAIQASPNLNFDPRLQIEPSAMQEIQQAWLAVGDVLTYDSPLPPEEWVDQSPVDRVFGE